MGTPRHQWIAGASAALLLSGGASAQFDVVGPYSAPVCSPYPASVITIEWAWDPFASSLVVKDGDQSVTWVRDRYRMRVLRPDGSVDVYTTTEPAVATRAAQEGEFCGEVRVEGTVTGVAQGVTPVAPTGFFIRPPAPPPSPRTIVGSSVFQSLVAGRTKTFSKTFTAGSTALLLVSSYYPQSQYTLTVTDDRGGTWTRDRQDNRTNGQYQVWSSTVTTTGPRVVTLSATASAYALAALVEIAHLGSFVTSATGAASGGTTSYFTAATGPLPSSPTLLIGLVHDYAPTNRCTPSGPYQVVGALGDAFHWMCVQAALVNSQSPQVLSGVVESPFKVQGATVLAAYRGAP